MAAGTLDSWMRASSTSKKRKSTSTDDIAEPQERPAKRPITSEHEKHTPDHQDEDITTTATNAQPSQLAPEDRPRISLKITEVTGDIFDAPPNTLIIHACNCQGSWGAGIAKAFHDRYPSAYKKYATHCNTMKQKSSLVGTALLIPPPPPTAKTSTSTKPGANGTRTAKVEARHFIGCLFTSSRFGRSKDPPAKILEATGPAMEDLLTQIQEWNHSVNDAESLREVRICQINSGLFNVPWGKTKAVLEGIDVSGKDVKDISVVVREE
ncbi:ADP-ribose 1''-phosphate phosphatase [Recurvomyces mirabilis]|uniref:ADP-ribose 1''-phosphate phosphatase n=1 Tax=Recurvomyces mirabilis TaxID=574656 RepID=A0AAE1C4J9_9PEZI|nr:ADP-ribose 1''-phosphate phosphatase [Recurvomyces mirabilis]KAK5160420.1 ADP-ribose 1''-phosphate phosphatase [Recurvomyces mirabilis]